jgi:hypothetical protein
VGVEVGLLVVGDAPLVVVGDALLVEVEEAPLLVVGAGLPDFGRYLIPVEGQFEVDPTGDMGTKVPVL